MQLEKKSFLLRIFIYYNMKFIEYQNKINFLDSMIIWPFFIKRPLWLYKYKRKSISKSINYINDKHIIKYYLTKEKKFWMVSFYYSNLIGNELDNRLFILYKQINLYLANMNKFLYQDINEIFYRKFLYKFSLYNLTGIMVFFDFFIESYISIYWRLNSMYFCIKWWINYFINLKKEDEKVLEDYIIKVNILRKKKKKEKFFLWDKFLNLEFNTWKEKFYNNYFFKDKYFFFTFSCYFFFKFIFISSLYIYNLYSFYSIYFLHISIIYKYILYQFNNQFNIFLQLYKYKNLFLISLNNLKKYIYKNKLYIKKNKFIQNYIYFLNLNFIFIYELLNSFYKTNYKIKIKFKFKKQVFLLYYFYNYLYIYIFFYFFELKKYIGYNLIKQFLSIYIYILKKNIYIRNFFYLYIKTIKEKQISSKNLFLKFTKDIYYRQLNNLNFLKYPFLKKVRLLYHSKRTIKIGFIFYKKWLYKKIKNLKKKEKLPDYRFRRYDLDWNLNRSLLVGQYIKLYDYKKTRLYYFNLQNFFFDNYLKELSKKKFDIFSIISLSKKNIQIIFNLFIKLKNKLLQYNLWIESYIIIYNNLYDYFNKNNYNIILFFEKFFELFNFIYDLFDLKYFKLNIIEKFWDLQFLIKKQIYNKNNIFFDFFFFKIQKRILFAQHYYYLEDYLIRSLEQNKNFFNLFFFDLPRYYRLYIYDIFVKKKKKSIYEKYFNKLFFLYLYNYLEFDIFFFKLQIVYYWYFYNYNYKNIIYKKKNNNKLFFFNVYYNKIYLFWEFILGEFSYIGRQWRIFLKEWHIANYKKKKKKIYFYYKPNKFTKNFREINIFNRNVIQDNLKLNFIYEYYNFFFKLYYNLKNYNFIFYNINLNYKIVLLNLIKRKIFVFIIKIFVSKILNFVYKNFYKQKLIFLLRRKKIKGFFFKMKIFNYLKKIKNYFNKYLFFYFFINTYLYKKKIYINYNYNLYIYKFFLKNCINYFFFNFIFMQNKTSLFLSIYKEWNFKIILKIKRYKKFIKKKKFNIFFFKKYLYKRKYKKFINLCSFFNWHLFLYKNCIYYKWFYIFLYKWLFICLFFLKIISKFLLKQIQWKKLLNYNYFDDIYKKFLNLRYKKNKNFLNLTFYENLKLYFFKFFNFYKYFFFFCTVSYSSWWYKYYNFIAFFNYLEDLYMFENNYLISYDYISLFFYYRELNYIINLYQFDIFSHITRFIPIRLNIVLKKRFLLRLGIYFFNFFFYFSLFLVQNINYYSFSFYILDKIFLKKDFIFFSYITDLYNLLINFLYAINLATLYLIKNIYNFSSFYDYIYFFKKYNGYLWYSSLKYQVYIDYISIYNKSFRLSCSFISFMYINLQAYLKLKFKNILLQEKKNFKNLEQFTNNLIINSFNNIINNTSNYIFMPFFYSDYNYINYNHMYNKKKLSKKYLKKNNFKYFLSQDINLFFIKNKWNNLLKVNYELIYFYNKNKNLFIKFLNKQYKLNFSKNTMKFFIILGSLRKKKLIPKNITKSIKINFKNLFLGFLYNQLDYYIIYDFSFLDNEDNEILYKKVGRKSKSNFEKYLEYLNNYVNFLKDYYIYDGFWLLQLKKKINFEFIIKFLKKRINYSYNKINLFINFTNKENWLYFLKNIIEKKNFTGLIRGIFPGIIDYNYCLDNLYKLSKDNCLINNLKIFFFYCKRKQKFILKYHNLYKLLLNFSYFFFDLNFFIFNEQLNLVRKDSWFLIFLKKKFLDYKNLKENLRIFVESLYYKDFCDLILFNNLKELNNIFFFGFYLQLYNNTIKLQIGYVLITFILVFLSIIKYKKEQCYYIINNFVLLFTFDDIYNFYKHICVQLYIFYYFVYNKNLLLYYDIIKKSYYLTIYKKIKKSKLNFTKKKKKELFFFSLKDISKEPLNKDLNFWLDLWNEKNNTKLKTINYIVNSSFLKANF